MNRLALSFSLLMLVVRTASAESAACTAAPGVACLTGRAGGQTLQGGVDATDPLTLKGPGPIRIEGGALFSPTMPDENGSLLTLSPTQKLNGRRVCGIDMSPAFRWTNPGALCGLRFGGMHDVDVDPTAVNFMSALHVNYTSRSTTAGVAPWFPDMIVEQWTAQMDGPGRAATTGLIPIAFAAVPVIKATNGSSLVVADRCATACGIGTNKSCTPATEAVDCAGCAGGTKNACSERGGLVTVYANPTLQADAGSKLSVVRRAVLFDRGVRFEGTAGDNITLATDNTLYIGDRSGGQTTRAIESQLTAGSRKFFLYSEGDAPSVHAGRLRIGDTTPPVAALDLAAGRDRYVRMGGAAQDPESPKAGDLWYNSQQHAHRIRSDAGTVGLSGVLSTVTRDSTPIQNSTDEIAFSNGGVEFPASSLAVGKTIRIRAGGRFSSGAAVPRLVVRWGAATTNPANVLVETGTPSLTGAVADAGWTLDADITVRATGASGGAAARGAASFGGPSGAAVIATDRKPGTTTIDTTAATTLAMLAQWPKAAAGDSITLETMTVEILD